MKNATLILSTDVMVAVAERYKVAREIKEKTPGILVKDMLTQLPSVRVAGDILLGPNKTLFITSTPKPISLEEYEKTNDLDFMAAELPQHTINYPKVDLSTVLENEGKRAIKLGYIDATIYSARGAAYNIQILHYPHPQLADLMLNFRKEVQEGKTHLYLRENHNLVQLLNSIRPMDMDLSDIQIEHMRNSRAESKPQRYLPWKAPGI